MQPIPRARGAPNGNVAIEKKPGQRPTGGQDWDDPAWWQATAKRLGIEKRTGELDDDWKDRTFEAVRRQRQAAAAKP